MFTIDNSPCVWARRKLRYKPMSPCDRPPEAGDNPPIGSVRPGGWSALKAALEPRGEVLPSAHNPTAAGPSHLLSILDGLADAVTVVDLNYRISFANRAAHKLMVIPPERAQGHLCSTAFQEQDPMCQGSDKCPVHHVIRSGQPFRSICNRYYRQGERALIDLTASPLLDSRGNVVQVILLQRDPTDDRLIRQHLTRTPAEQIKEASAIAAVAQANEGTADLRSVLQTACVQLRQALQAERCLILLANDSGDELVLAAWTGPSEESLDNSRHILIEGSERTIWQFALSRRQVLAVDENAEPHADRRANPSGARGRSVMAAPLLARGTPLGILYVDFGERLHHWTEQEKGMAGLLADQMALVVDNAKAYERVKQRAGQVTAINEMSRIISSSLDLREILASLARGLPRIVSFDRASITLIDELGVGQERYELRGQEISRARAAASPYSGGSASAWVVEHRVPWISKNLPRQITFREDADLLAEGIQSRAVLPLVVKNRALGVFALESYTANSFAECDLETLVPIAGQLGSAIDNAQLFEEARRRTLEVSILHSLALDTTKTLDEGVVIRLAIERLERTADSQLGAIFLFDEERRSLRLRGSRGECAGIVRHFEHSGKCDEAPMLLGALSGTVFIPDLSDYPSLIPVAPRYLAPTSMAAIPVRTGGIAQGVLVLVSSPGKDYSPRQVELFEALCNQISIGIERSRLHAEASRLAITDGLTELYNHRYFYQRLAEEFRRARAFCRPMSLLFIDVDNLRTVNDARGHLQGDNVLRALGQVIKQQVRGTDIVARYGGDEFTVILPESTEYQAEALAKRLQSAVSRANLLSPHSPGDVTISIGIAYLTSDVTDESQLVRRADQAAYRAKAMGKDTLFVYGRD